MNCEIRPLRDSNAQLAHLPGNDCTDMVLRNFVKVVDESVVIRLADGRLDESFLMESKCQSKKTSWAGGTSIKGEATQAILENANQVEKVFDLNTENQVWPVN